MPDLLPEIPSLLKGAYSTRINYATQLFLAQVCTLGAAVNSHLLGSPVNNPLNNSSHYNYHLAGQSPSIVQFMIIT